MDQEEAIRIANDFLLKTRGEVRRVRNAGLLPYDLFLSGAHAKWMIVYKVLPGEAAQLLQQESLDAESQTRLNRSLLVAAYPNHVKALEP